MSITREDVLAEIGRSEQPLSSHIIAARLQKSAGSVSTICSKLWMYGQLERVKQTGHPFRYLYSLKVRA